MSRSKRARAKGRKRAALRPVQRSERPPASVGAPASRLAPARRRGRFAKLGIGAVALVSVVLSMVLARVTYAGHPKRPIKNLAIPQPLYRVVRQDLLQAGILAPATAPPDIATSTS